MSFTKPNPNWNKFIPPEGYVDLGWQLSSNHWVFEKIKKQKLKTREFDNSMYMNRATNIITICDVLKVYWHTDMSD